MTGSAPELSVRELPRLFDGSLPPGVYRLRAEPDAAETADLPARASTVGWHPALLELTGVRGKSEFLDRCAAALDLPGWFGRNWDALADCLTDLSWWGEPAGHLLVATGWRGFETASPADAATAEEILAAAAAYWSARSIPFTALLVQGLPPGSSPAPDVQP
ncbi:barstar family protein [Streptomyces sp. XM4193]|uniref:barstar family protein n=1 Tax=Streptomyces sp. XM4193 TaxID=2929782 RepID=UPI001FFA597F|nr:barstar family protein [Streptomyces sp. XM4193]MCK1796564.1 barstar family protein [Streptomyces sp. XM4193]